MYLIEWILWHMQTSRYESEGWQEKLEKHLAISRAGKLKHEDELPGVQERTSENPNAEGSLYDFNETYIEVMAGGSQARRGVITFITLMVMYVVYKQTSMTVLLNTVWFTGVYYSGGDPATMADYAVALFMAALAAGLFYVVIRYVRIIINLENFVQRRLLIRFNRVTRQVYLHRPRFAGGITVLDWEQVTPQSVVGQEEAENIGRQVLLLWDPAVTGLPHLHLVFVGKTADGTSDLVNLWEFIRRYMEEGPESVPAPKKLVGKTPWPWQSVMASLSFFRPLWRAGLRWQVAFWVTLTSPALLLHSAGHWVSLLLCWEPRWPRIIREAGLPGKPVPPLSSAADWPPLPLLESTKAKSRRTHKPRSVSQEPLERAPTDAAYSPSEVTSAPPPNTQQQDRQ